MINVSLYSCVMGLLWFNIGVIIIFILRRSNRFISINGIKILFVLALGCIFRIICPIDLSFAKIVRSKNVYPWILDRINEPLFLSVFNLFNLFIIACVSMGTFLFIYEIIKYIRFRRFIEELGTNASDEVESVYRKVLDELNIKNPPKLIQNINIPTPYMTGFFKPIIALPERDFSEKELYYICRHEVVHYKNNDVWVKWFSVFMFSMLWWNPLTHFFKDDLTQILELKCDDKACEHWDDTQKVEYTKTIKNLLEFAHDTYINIKPHYYSSAMAKGSVGSEHIRQRFEMILHTPTTKKQRASSYVIFIAMFMTLMLSYVFIIQPIYLPPTDDFPIQGKGLSIVFEDGVYKLYGDGDFVMIIDEETLKLYTMQGVPFSR